MADITKVNIKGTTYDVHDIEARNTMSGIMDRLEALENNSSSNNNQPSTGVSDYTAWEVYPTTSNKAVGAYKRTFMIEGKEVTFSNKEAIPANATEFIKIFTSSPAAKSDVVVDWGDGSQSVVANGDYDNVAYEDNGETVFDLRHTYEKEGFFIVKVYGKGYWKISHPTINSKSLMSRVFADDLPIASHLSNMAAFCAFTNKLLYVDVPPYHRIVYAANLANLFTHAKNLQRVTGFKRMYNAYNVGGMFFENQFLKYTDFRFSPDMYVADTIFQSCGELTVDINKMFQNQDGYYLEFKNSYVKLYRAFVNCASLIGPISDNLKNILWNSSKTTFKSTETFTNATNLVSQVPVSWGGDMPGGNVTVSGGGKGLSYIYINTPTDEELEREDLVLVEIDFANNEDFSDKASFALTDCWVFNPATGVWEAPSASGLSLSYCNSMLRLKYPESSYTLCRYRWKYTDNSYIKGSYNIALI